MYLLQIDTPSDWELFLGHFHPVVVHLPIGMLVIAFILELVRIKTKSTQLNNAIQITLFWGFVSAIISCVFGWLLSSSGDYNETTLFWHQWLGISVAFISGLAWLLKRRGANGLPHLSKLYTALLFFMMASITITGHLGGNMTHGEDYLTANTPQPFRGWLGIKPKPGKEPRKKIADIAEATVYHDLVEPALEAKCWNCHNATKKKGGLRMDTEELLMKGGKDGLVIKAKDAAGSELIKRLFLPKEDDKRMPPKGKPSLNEKEIALVKWWIDNGASFTSKVKNIAMTAEVEPYFKTFSGGVAGNRQAKDSVREAPLSKVFLRKTAFASKVDIDLLKKENLLVTQVSQNQPFLEVSAVNDAGFDDAKIGLLNKVSPQLVWLKIQDTKITDAGLKALIDCKNLVRLNLENTQITSSSMEVLKGFGYLEYLNIVSTNIDDNGLLQLVAVKSLKNIYCWQSGVTEKGIETFRKINPGVTINIGGADKNGLGEKAAMNVSRK